VRRDRPRVLASLEDETGDRCVDLLAVPGGVAWVDCRRDPEDGHGWRRLSAPSRVWPDRAAARAAAADAVGWLAPG